MSRSWWTPFWIRGCYGVIITQLCGRVRSKYLWVSGFDSTSTHSCIPLSCGVVSVRNIFLVSGFDSTPIHICIHLKLVTEIPRFCCHMASVSNRRWVDAGKPVDALDSTQKTPLHHAAQWGQEETLDFLIDCGADVNSPDFIEDSPLHFVSDSCGSRPTILLC